MISVDFCLQMPAITKLHNDQFQRGILKNVKTLDKVWMIKLHHKLGLTFNQSFEDFFLVQTGLFFNCIKIQNFNSDRFIVGFVDCFPYRAERSSSKILYNTKPIYLKSNYVLVVIEVIFVGEQQLLGFYIFRSHRLFITKTTFL